MSSSSSAGYSLSKINPKLLRRIYRACRPSLSESNLALNLEICDFVNAKQGSAPREAAIAVVKLIGQKDPQTSELALALLDNLVKNCGYPFHLQISRKEFLNELVKRFPEVPPLRYSRVQRLILAQIEEWYQTISKTSKYKEDFGYIRDMHRLLVNKGYVFPEIRLEDAAVLNPSDSLKSLEELQKEEAVVHSAKLQELIRRGRPQDLQEANKLMKVMAGYKDDNVEENKKQIKGDIARLKRKVEILGEMLNSIEASNGSIDESSEAVTELYASVKSAQPNVTKIIEEETDNEEHVKELLEFNEIINAVISKYQLLRNGKKDEAANIKVSGSLGNNDDLNLIDFDDDVPVSTDKSGQEDQGYNDLLSDLSNLRFIDNGLNNFGSGGSIALGAAVPGSSTSSTGIAQPHPNHAPTSGSQDLMSELGSPSPQLQSNTPNHLDPFGLSFPSSTPSSIQGGDLQETRVINQSSNLKIEIGQYSSSSKTLFSGKALFGNPSSTTINRFKFMLAVPKSCKLNLKPQSGDVIYAFNDKGVTQEFTIENSFDKQLKVKWKADYQIGGVSKEEIGVAVLSDN